MMSHDEWTNIDLNPIENTWTILGNNVRNHESSVSTVDELINALHDEWTNIGLLVTRNTIQSMRQHCNDCVGTTTSY